MPNRILREAILTSDHMAAIGWPEEVFYRRLMSVVDDYGRFDARLEILRSRLYPLQLDKVGTPDIAKWMRSCAEAGLVREYTVEGKPYVLIYRFGQPTRTPSKYPAPEDEIICAQKKSNDCLSVSGSECGSGSGCGCASPLTPQGGKRKPRLSRDEKTRAHVDRLAKAGEP